MNMANKIVNYVHGYAILDKLLEFITMKLDSDICDIMIYADESGQVSHIKLMIESIIDGIYIKTYHE